MICQVDKVDEARALTLKLTQNDPYYVETQIQLPFLWIMVLCLSWIRPVRGKASMKDLINGGYFWTKPCRSHIIWVEPTFVRETSKHYQQKMDMLTLRSIETSI